MDFLNEIVSLFPIRKSDEQKKAFRDWALAKAAELGYDARIESAGKKSETNNVVIGDPDTAKVIYTAHYDTPPRALYPTFMFADKLPYVLNLVLLVVGMFLLCFVLAFAAFRLTENIIIAYLAIYPVCFGIPSLMMHGPANKNNVNDNTSGVAGVFSLMASLPEDVRKSAAFILFDNEEKGLVGSKAYAKAHPELEKNALVLNMDCIGDGEHILMAVNKDARSLPEIDALEKTMQSVEGRHFEMLRTNNFLASDHKNFKRGVMVCACRKGKRIGYYAPNIHSKKDTFCDPANIDYLTKGLTAFTAQLSGGET
ncbi:MAG: M28 family peptidase [Clostridia bacterium]|nr:M28 family peptidase [Clostridia bacterium]